MIHDISPGFVKIHYTTTYGTHVETIPIANPTLVLGTWEIDEKGTPLQAWNTSVGRYLAALQGLTPTTQSFTLAELYTKAVGAPPVLVDSFAPALAGTDASAAKQASEFSIGFRTSLGGRGRIVQLDSIFTPNIRQVPPAYGGSAGIVAFAAYLVSAHDMVFGRDGGWPTAVGKFLTKTNDTLRHQYGLD